MNILPTTFRIISAHQPQHQTARWVKPTTILMALGALGDKNGYSFDFMGKIFSFAGS